MYRKPLIIAAACALFAQAAVGQATDVYWEIGKESKVSVPRDAGSYRLILLGRVNGAAYQADVTLESIPIPPLPQPGSVASPSTVPNAAIPRPSLPSTSSRRCTLWRW